MGVAQKRFELHEVHIKSPFPNTILVLVFFTLAQMRFDRPLV